MHSLRFRLLGLWLLSLAASVAVGLLLVQLYRQSTEAQVQRAEALVAHACDLIRDRYSFYTAGWSGPSSGATEAKFQTDLVDVVEIALLREDGIEGGVWQSGLGPLAYAFPTYEGGGPKSDLPSAERAQIQAVNQQAARDDQAADRRVSSRTETLLLHACPLGGPIIGLTGWTMTRVHAAEGFHSLQLGLAVLLTLMGAMAIWLGRIIVIWGRHVRGIEEVLRRPTAADMPVVPRTGERELDQIIDALNVAGERLGQARVDAEEMADRVSRAERMAGLGRVAAVVAHEIRNPLAALRLQGENALAGDDARRRIAISDMLGQVGRLDDLASELLAMTQRVTPQPERVELTTFLKKVMERHRELVAVKRVTLVVENGEGTAIFDPAIIGRVLDNLLTNAIRHALEGGRVVLEVEWAPPSLVLTVRDTGAGVPPAMKDHLFEPFVTSRSDGTGLGLAIARELTDAHGGRLILRHAGGTSGFGAVFALELPLGDTWPQS